MMGAGSVGGSVVGGGSAVVLGAVGGVELGVAVRVVPAQPVTSRSRSRSDARSDTSAAREMSRITRLGYRCRDGNREPDPTSHTSVELV